MICISNWDKRYQRHELKQRVVQIHFEFVRKFIDIVREWNAKIDDHKKKIYKEIEKIKKKIDALSPQNVDVIPKSTHEKKTNVVDTSQVDIVKNELTRLTSKYLDDLDAEDKAGKYEKRQLLAVVLHIIRNVDFNLLSTWFCLTLDQSKRDRFLEIIQTALIVFEYGQKEKIKKQQRVRKHSIGGVKSAQESKDNTRSLTFKLDHPIQKLRALTSFDSKLKLKAQESPQNQDTSNRGIEISIDTSDNDKKRRQPLRSPETEEDTQTKKSKEGGSPTISRSSSYSSLASLLLEKHIPYHVSFYCLWLSTKLISDMDSKDKSNQQSFLNSIGKTITFFLRLHQPEKILLSVLSYLRSFLATYSSL
jgi:hypothetical protein